MKLCSGDIPFTTHTGILHISEENTMPMEEQTTLHEVKIQEIGSSGNGFVGVMSFWISYKL
jgi:hypothetical protein